MKNKYLIIILILITALASAKKITIKLATLAPQGSEMHALMVEMGQQWEAATEGNVTLRIYPNGVVGDERDMIRKIRIGQIHAAAVTTEGLSVISPDVYGFLVPMLFDDFDDVDWVRNGIAEELENDFNENGFIILNWGDVGWAYWFTKKPLKNPQDLESMKIFTWAGDYHSDELWKNAGYHSVQIAYLDVLSGLQTGLIDAIATPSIIALSNQYIGSTKYMLDLKWGLVTGGTVIDKKIWNRIQPEHQNQMLAIAREIGVRQQSENRKVDQQAIAAMEQYGLIVYTPSDEEVKTWKVLVKSFYPLIRGSLIPEKIFDRVIQLKAEKDLQDTLITD